MWCLLLLLGSSLSMVLGNEDACKDAIMNTYKIYRDKVDFPKTTGEIKELCTYLFDLNNQYVKTFEACKENLLPQLWVHKDYYPIVFRNLTEFCSSESSVNKVLGNSDQCKDAILDAYKVHKDTVDFPKTSEELQETCKYLFDMNKQLVRTYEACKEDLPPELWIHKDYYPTVFRNVTEFCNTQSDVNKALVKDLGCLSTVYEGQSETCAQLTNTAMEKSGITNEYDGLTKCMRKLFKYSCLVKNAGDTCGSDAESAVFEGTALLKSMNEFCTAYMMMQVMEKLPEIGLDDAIKQRVGTFVGALAWDETFPISFN